ncbi:MAG: response regulator [Planctomycetota bacterium]|jgi:CheY-like chemotaxis protein
MEQKHFHAICDNGQLPDPRTINIRNIVEDMWPIYQDTVKSYLSELADAAMALEAGRDIDEYIPVIRRVLHSIKGSSGVVGLTEVSDVCQWAESAFEEITDTTASADMLLKIKAWIETVINYISEGDISADQQLQLNRIKQKPKLKALIIDDDPVCRQRLNSLLGDYFDCSLAVNGREGFEAYIESRAQNNPYDLITLDMNMPAFDGRETIQAIRQWEDENGVEGNDVKIIIITSEADSIDIVSSLKQSGETYIVKSAPAEKLLDEIAKLGLLQVVKER